MAKETLPTKLEVAVWDLTESITKLRVSQDMLIDQQKKTNTLLDQLVKANTAFLGTLTVFLDQDHRLKLDQERKRNEHAKSLEPTKGDLIY
jgi:hypothetical protein